MGAIKSFRQKKNSEISKLYELGADARNVDVTVTLGDGTVEIHNLQKMIDNKEIGGGGGSAALQWKDIY